MPPANSAMLELGTPMPDFSLPDFGVDGENGSRMVSSGDLPTGSPVLVMFICNHCPFVIHIQEQLAALGRDYADRVSIVAINANNPETHPDDAPAKMTEKAAEAGYPFPYLFDETQETAQAFSARCTPDFFLFGADRRLAYRGQLDGSRPSNDTPVTGGDLRAALDGVLEGAGAPTTQHPSLGCGIKWKPGNAPPTA
jgi:thiol-disulfide isomerase/thioredoxin